jgi:hypothetical protein
MVRGRWLLASKGSAGTACCHAEDSCQISREGPVTIHRVRFRIRSEKGYRIELLPDSVVRVRGRLEKSEPIKIMLFLSGRIGGFAGNFFYRTEDLPSNFCSKIRLLIGLE